MAREWSMLFVGVLTVRAFVRCQCLVEAFASSSFRVQGLGLTSNA